SVRVILKENKESIGYNIVTGTYDKAAHFIKEVSNNKEAKAMIIADEAHKEVSDYFFRKRAIKGLFDLREHPQVAKFIALSGTPQEIDKDNYDYMVKFELMNDEPVF